MEKYDKKRFLGRGGFGSAFLVERKSDKKLFVIKTMKFYQSVSKKKFAENEVKILKSANHPNIVRFGNFLESF